MLLSFSDFSNDPFVSLSSLAGLDEFWQSQG